MKTILKKAGQFLLQVLSYLVILLILIGIVYLLVKRFFSGGIGDISGVGKLNKEIKELKKRMVKADDFKKCSNRDNVAAVKSMLARRRNRSKNK